MNIEMKRDINGSFHNITCGVKAGDVVDCVDDANAARYIELGYATPAGTKPVTVFPDADRLTHY